MELTEKNLGKEHYDTLLAMDNYSSVLLAQSKHQAAEPIVRDELRRREKVQGHTHLHTMLTARILGETLISLGRFEDAEGILKRALVGIEQVQRNIHEDTIHSIQLLLSTLNPRVWAAIFVEGIEGVSGGVGHGGARK